MASKKKTTNGVAKKPSVKEVRQAEWESVLRSEIHLTDYNPRKISNSGAEKLRKQIREDTLVDAIIVNKRTMNVVGGNQRTVQLDKLYKYRPGISDYRMNVQTVDVDERTEIKINARLNNPDASGEYDAAKILDIVTTYEMDPLKEMNFDRDTFDILVNESGYDSPLDNITEIIREVRGVNNERGDLEISREESEKPNFQELRKKYKEDMKAAGQSGDSEYYERDDYILTIVFNSNQEKQTFLKKIGRPQKDKFIKGSKIRDIIKPEYL